LGRTSFTIGRVKHRIRYLFISLICALCLLVAPLTVVAEGVVDETVPFSPVIITEVQTGAATASDEFIELYNQTPEALDITGWQIRYANAGLAVDGPTQLVAEITSNDGPILLPAHSYFVLHAPSISLPLGVAGQTYTPSLSKSDKTLALFARDESLCQMVVHDALAWGVTPGTTLGEGAAVPAAGSGAHLLLQRYLDQTGGYVDTNNNQHDFWLVQGTPGADNPVLPAHTDPVIGSPSPLAPFAANNCAADPPENPIPNEGLAPLLITELLPNPDQPFLEPNDEFIELYNPNDTPFQLKDYSLEVGTTTKSRYTFTEGSIAPQTYKAFYFTETDLRLVNANGQARLLDPAGAILAETDPYATAGGNKAWALINDTWEWSTTPTPNLPNAGDQPEPTPQSPNQGLAAPQLTEILPAPGNGQLEFIELYNPNDQPFDLGGYILETGTTTKYRFTFAAGTLLQPKKFSAFYADQTKVTLANKAGQVRLLDPNGTIITESSPYNDAKDNQAWILQDDTWQWTTSPTPNAANVLAVPQVASKKVASAKKTTPKTTKPKSTKESDNDNQGALLAATKPDDPIHPGVLALVGAFALLYGAYEYRHDIANKIRKFRSNRATSRPLG